MVKLFFVVPLTCVTVPTRTETPVETKFATSDLTSMPKGGRPDGMVTAIVPAPMLTFPAAEGLVKTNEVISLSESAVTVTVTV